MNNEDIKRARINYIKLKKEKDDIKSLEEQLRSLEENPIVQRYLELKNLEGTKTKDDNLIILDSFSNIKTSNIPNEEKIFVYMGAYKHDSDFDKKTDILLSDNDFSEADYYLYFNIDSEFDNIIIKPSNKNEFEKKHNVLKFSTTNNIKEKYRNLQIYYYEELLNMDLRGKNKILTLLNYRLI